jgi:hypothetical protein
MRFRAVMVAFLFSGTVALASIALAFALLTEVGQRGRKLNWIQRVSNRLSEYRNVSHELTVPKKRADRNVSYELTVPSRQDVFAELSPTNVSGTNRMQRTARLFFIVTTVLSEYVQVDPGTVKKLEQGIRHAQYRRCIKRLINVTRGLNATMIIVEGNGQRQTMLQEFGLSVLYTRNNLMKTVNKGKKELQDILDCIAHFGMVDSDFVVKVTGRYLVHDDSPFIKILSNPNFDLDALIKFGSFFKPVDFQMEDSVTALIGMRAGYIKKISIRSEAECIEHSWARISYWIPISRLGVVKTRLGIDICPGSNTYFSI